MQFLRTLFWAVLAVVAAIFAMRNWNTVPVSLWGGLVADVKLPALLLVAFLLGLLPSFTLYRTMRWRLRRRLDQAERSLAEARLALAPTIDPHAELAASPGASSPGSPVPPPLATRSAASPAITPSAPDLP